jgi:uncharacterized phage-associated protein
MICRMYVLGPNLASMTLSAHDVAAELRRRLPGLGRLKLHKLLYYCQGQHLAHYGRPLFAEPISAWDKGPVVGTLWKAEEHGTQRESTALLDEGQLNTIGYVLHRYGSLTSGDLVNLTHSESPWRRAARRPRESAPIRQEWMTEYFRTAGADEADDSEDIVLDSAEVSAWLRGATPPGPHAGDEDTTDALLARLRGA